MIKYVAYQKMMPTNDKNKATKRVGDVSGRFCGDCWRTEGTVRPVLIVSWQILGGTEQRGALRGKRG